MSTTFETQKTHSVRSISLLSLLKSREHLVHLQSSIPVVMANYQVKSGGGWWFSFSTAITRRLPDLEPCSGSLEVHLNIPVGSATAADTLAVSASDYKAIMRATGDIPTR